MLKLLAKNKFRVVLLFCWAALSLFQVFAQDRVLTPGEPIDGSIDADNAAQVYTFRVVEGDEVSLTLTPQTGLALAIIVTDAAGNSIAQGVGDSSNPDLSLTGIQIAEAGVFYVTVFPSAAADGTGSGAFVLTFDVAGSSIEPETTPDVVVETTDEPTEDVDPTAVPTTAEAEFNPGQQVVLNNGIQVTLGWNTIDDLNLQVRDPVGGTLFWDSRSTIDGGTFGLDANGLCEIETSPAIETAEWPGGAVAVGSYEVLVYYRQACAGNNPVDFTVDIVVDDTPLDPIIGSILPPVNNVANVYISSFTVDSNGQATRGPGGPYLDTRDLDVPSADLIAEADIPLILNEPVTGLLTNADPYESFSYEGLAGEILTVSLTATTGNLDTLLLVLDSSGNVVAGNDDVIVAENTNSRLDSLILPAEDVYTVVATRYGKLVGGTEGNFELLVTGSEIPAELLTLDLPSGDIEVTLTWETNADLQLLVRDPSGNSVYDDVVTVPSGGRLTAQGNVNCTIPEGNPVSYIYWPEGFLRIGSYEVEVWHQSECNDTRDVFFTLYVVVGGQLIFTDNVNIAFNEKYVTSFSIDQTGQASASVYGGGILGGSETLNYQEELPSAITIAPGQAVPGSITADDKFDVYTFDGLAGDLVTIELRATSATLDTMLFLIDPNGIEIASNDDSNETTNSLISDLLLSQDGQYTIIATHFGTIYGGTTGGYNLTLRIDR